MKRITFAVLVLALGYLATPRPAQAIGTMLPGGGIISEIVPADITEEMLLENGPMDYYFVDYPNGSVVILGPFPVTIGY